MVRKYKDISYSVLTKKLPNSVVEISYTRQALKFYNTKGLFDQTVVLGNNNSKHFSTLFGNSSVRHHKPHQGRYFKVWCISFNNVEFYLTTP